MTQQTRTRATSVPAGTFAVLREYVVKAAAYDAAYNRQADNVMRRELWARSTVVVITAVTSLSAFGSLFVENPSTWARVVVFALAALTSALTALRQEGTWARESDLLRADGCRWTDQHNRARNLLAQLCDTGTLPPHALDKLAEQDAALVTTNRPVPNHLYDRFKAARGEDFDKAFHRPPGTRVRTHDASHPSTDHGANG